MAIGILTGVAITVVLTIVYAANRFGGPKPALLVFLLSVACMLGFLYPNYRREGLGWFVTHPRAAHITVP